MIHADLWLHADPPPPVRPVPIGMVRLPGEAEFQLLSDQLGPFTRPQMMPRTPAPPRATTPKQVRRRQRLNPEGRFRGVNAGPWADEEVDFVLAWMEKGAAPRAIYEQYRATFDKPRSPGAIARKMSDIRGGRGHRKARVDAWAPEEIAALQDNYRRFGNIRDACRAHSRKCGRSPRAVEVKLRQVVKTLSQNARPVCTAA